jgi:hypothetical protein
VGRAAALGALYRVIEWYGVGLCMSRSALARGLACEGLAAQSKRQLLWLAEAVMTALRPESEPDNDHTCNCNCMYQGENQVNPHKSPMKLAVNDVIQWPWTDPVDEKKDDCPDTGNLKPRRQPARLAYHTASRT